MPDSTILKRIFDSKSRANPYPLFAQLRETPVSWQEDGPNEKGTWVVSTYRDIVELFHDPRLSSDLRKGAESGGPRSPLAEYLFISRDPPDHDRMRAMAMRHFGPPERPSYVEQLRPKILEITTSLIDRLPGDRDFDLVAKVAYPLPVAVICEILGVPREDQARFKEWADDLVTSIAFHSSEAVSKRDAASKALAEYLSGLVKLRRRQPGDDMLSRLANDRGPDGVLDERYLAATGTLLLVAGHETTVNLIANGMLTLLRHPDIIERLRHEPDLVIGTVEELLRYEPPVQFLANRTTLQEIRIGDVTIPKGVLVTMALAAGNRDPDRFEDPDRFDPERPDNGHLGFGSGIHYCFGAPLARVEAQIALLELARRLVRPQLLQDPPPYRESPLLRGPAELRLAIEGVRDVAESGR
jgi:cytochrome P450